MCKIIVMMMFCFPVIVIAQKTGITLKEKQITIRQIVEQIELRTGYSIAYNKEVVDADRKVTVDLKNASLDEALAAILNPVGFTYILVDDHIIIKPLTEKKEKVQPVLCQTIRGIITDKASGKPIPFATVFLVRSDPWVGAVCDSTGQFSLVNIPVGRYALRVSSVGYESVVVNEIWLSSAKEFYCEVAMNERVMKLGEVVVRPQVKKELLLNPMALTGGRMVSMEEANRYAGGFDDPARLVSSFAGVAGCVGSNAIAVRGNSPQFFQWKLEGVEIPNPTHFSDMNGIGGGILTALSSQVMGNSDFFNGAFPAEYNNALSGVLDMHIRNGNTQKHEHAFQFGLMGVDVASEGPLSKQNKSSYIFNYRYSTMALMNRIAGLGGMTYQDLSFKLNFPTRKAGIFSVWGIGLLDKNHAEAERDSSEWVSLFDKEEVNTFMAKAAGGVGHTYYVGKDTYLKTSLAATFTKNNQDIFLLDDKLALTRAGDLNNHNWDLVLSSYINKKITARHTNRTGVTLAGLAYDTDFRMSPDPYVPMDRITKGDGFTSVFSAFTNSVIRLNDQFTANVGLTGQFFLLNKHWSVEPRISMKWQTASFHSLSFAYGLNSRRERLEYYYVRTSETKDTLVNKNLKLAKAHHLGLSYSWKVTPDIHLKVEPYFQYLFDVAVEPGTPFSVIDHNGYVMNKQLESTGKGRNYGIDVTLEQYMSRGWFWLVSGSLFKSEYRGGDGVWRRSRLDQRFLLNALAGKEWIWGERRQHVLNASVRFSYQGGQLYAPIDLDKSHENENVYFDETKGNTMKMPDSFVTDLTLSYKLNKEHVAHEFGLKILNVNGFRQIGYRYNYKIGDIESLREAAIIPNLSYKIYF